MAKQIGFIQAINFKEFYILKKETAGFLTIQSRSERARLIMLVRLLPMMLGQMNRGDIFP